MPISDPATARAFGLTLRIARRQRGLAQSTLADKAEIDRTMVSHYERGTRGPSLTVVIALARALEIDPLQLIANTLKQLERLNHETGETGARLRAGHQTP